MYIIWLATILYLVIGYLFQHHITDTSYLTFSFIIFTVIVLFFVLLINYTKFIVIIYTSFLVRMTMMFVDASEGESVIPHSGDDTENFYNTAIEVSNNLSLLNESIYGGTYSKFLGLIFHLYGDDRLFTQFLNIIITISAILIIIKVFRMLGIRDDIQIYMVVMMSFFPHSLIFSSILLRESIISLMVVLSLYFFIRWFTQRERTGAVLSVAFVLIGAMFHTAIISILLGYLFGFIFYRHETNTFRFSVESVVPFSLFAMIMSYLLIFPDVISTLPIFNKVEQVLDDSSNVYEEVTSARGDTAYLGGLEINNLFQLILFSPLKMVYFIGSPMPWAISNFNELISFFLDAVFHFAAAGFFITYFNTIRKQPLLMILLISIFAGWFIFGLGVSNAGTALRHRFKLFYIIILLFGLIWKRIKK